jgi:hypothetical protein
VYLLLLQRFSFQLIGYGERRVEQDDEDGRQTETRYWCMKSLSEVLGLF